MLADQQIRANYLSSNINITLLDFFNSSLLDFRFFTLHRLVPVYCFFFWKGHQILIFFAWLKENTDDEDNVIDYSIIPVKREAII